MSPVIYGTKPPTHTRPDKDAYVTPHALADAAVVYLVQNWLPDAAYRDPDSILDTGAGTGVWGAAWRNYTNAGYLRGIEVRELSKPNDYDDWVVADFLEWQPDSMRYSIILGNPPFSQAEAFIHQSLGLLSPQGVLLYLLPSGFQHGERLGRGLFAETPPTEVVSLCQRPNFAGMGNQNVNDYILLIWTGKYDGPSLHGWLDWK